ncbi:MAG: (2Fe-2S)-binding protein [Scytolyngbya sp. HA4215-MV1]|nr:(2Fe-2S)-binding protein [Scytolyngbya sp. HA4215-MV1]
MSTLCTVSFPGTPYPALWLDGQQNLSEHLTMQNSPVLFGCRTGICGTCLVEVEGDIPAPKPDEREMLDLLAPNQAKARLACQLILTGDIKIRRWTE